MSFEFASSDASFFKSTPDLMRLPARPWIFGMGDVVVPEDAPPRRPAWLYAPIFRNRPGGKRDNVLPETKVNHEEEE